MASAATLSAQARTSRAVLKSVFGYDAFRGFQGEVIDHVLAGGDALVLMPMGGGKSVCYQLPALLRDGLGVVVSPLIALMQDQVAALSELGVRAAFLNSTLDACAAAAMIGPLRSTRSGRRGQVDRGQGVDIRVLCRQGCTYHAQRRISDRQEQ
jgi:ATP-dependent DNA helicase RecQ